MVRIYIRSKMLHSTSHTCDLDCKRRICVRSNTSVCDWWKWNVNRTTTITINSNKSKANQKNKEKENDEHKMHWQYIYLSISNPPLLTVLSLSLLVCGSVCVRCALFLRSITYMHKANTHNNTHCWCIWYGLLDWMRTWIMNSLYSEKNAYTMGFSRLSNRFE